MPQQSASASTCVVHEDSSAPVCSADGWAMQPGAIGGSASSWDCAAVQTTRREQWQQLPAEAEHAAVDLFPIVLPLQPGSSVLVLLQNVPSELCNVSMMEVVLQQAHLEASVVQCVADDISVGEVTLALPSIEMAEACIVHFQGCQWGVAGTNLLARFVGVHEEPMTTSISVGGILFDVADPAASEYCMEIDRNIERVLCALLEPCGEADQGRRSKKRTFKKAAKVAEQSAGSPQGRRAPQPAMADVPAASRAEACAWGHADAFPVALMSNSPQGLTEQSVRGSTHGGACARRASLGASEKGVPLHIGGCGKGVLGEVHDVELHDAARKECSESVSTEDGTGVSGTSEAELSDLHMWVGF